MSCAAVVCTIADQRIWSLSRITRLSKFRALARWYTDICASILGPTLMKTTAKNSVTYLENLRLVFRGFSGLLCFTFETLRCFIEFANNVLHSAVSALKTAFVLCRYALHNVRRWLNLFLKNSERSHLSWGSVTHCCGYCHSIRKQWVMFGRKPSSGSCMNVIASPVKTNNIVLLFVAVLSVTPTALSASFDLPLHTNAKHDATMTLNMKSDYQ